MDVFEAIDTRISVSVLRDPGPTDRQWEIFCARARGLPIMADCGLGGFSSCAAKRASCSGASWPRPCARASRIRLRKRSTANGANPCGRQPYLSWPSSLFRIPACPKSSKFWRAAPRRRIFCSPPMPLALARFGARARRPITTMSRERSACPRRGASSPSSILARLMLRLYEASPPSRQAPWTGGRPRENSPCREAGDSG